MGLLYTLLVLNLVIFIHELGHYIVMQRNGVHVEVFSVGFGPILWKQSLKNGTEFRWCLILFGGYVQPREVGKGSMEEVSPGARFRIAAAGMFFNATSAFIVAFIALHFFPGQTSAYLPKVTFSRVPPEYHTLVVALVITYGLWLATPYLLVKLIASGLGNFFGAVQGPIGIIADGTSAASSAHGSSSTLFELLTYFVALSIGVAGFNLIPISPLDGAHMAESVLTKIIGKSPPPRLMHVYRTLSGIIMISLIVAIMYSDIIKTFFHK